MVATLGSSLKEQAMCFSEKKETYLVLLHKRVVVSDSCSRNNGNTGREKLNGAWRLCVRNIFLSTVCSCLAVYLCNPELLRSGAESEASGV